MNLSRRELFNQTRQDSSDSQTESESAADKIEVSPPPGQPAIGRNVPRNPAIAPVDQTQHPAHINKGDQQPEQNDAYHPDAVRITHTPDGLKLPDLHEGVLDQDKLHQLFSDIAKFTKVFGIIARYQKRGFEDGTNVSLRQAEKLLNEKEVRAVQIRYLYDNGEWWDTLMPTPKGIRLVRIRHDPS